MSGDRTFHKELYRHVLLELRRRLRIVSSQVGTIDASLQPRWSRERRLALACQLLPRLELSSLISHRFPVERASEAYQLVEQHPEDTVQVVFTYR